MAVSYAHLALKEALKKTYGGAEEEIADDSGNIQGFKVLLAVSYTHLDVYNRQ